MFSSTSRLATRIFLCLLMGLLLGCVAPHASAQETASSSSISAFAQAPVPVVHKYFNWKSSQDSTVDSINSFPPIRTSHKVLGVIALATALLANVSLRPRRKF